jgi:hypothetical protein
LIGPSRTLEACPAPSEPLSRNGPVTAPPEPAAGYAIAVLYKSSIPLFRTNVTELCSISY